MLRRGTIRPARGLAVALALASVTLTPLAAEAKLRIVATLPDLWALTSAVVGDEATVEVATRFGQNPHDMEIRPSQTLLIRRADVLVRNGLEEDAWVDAVAESAGNPSALRVAPTGFEASQGIPVLKVADGWVRRSLGHVLHLDSLHYALYP